MAPRQFRNDSPTNSVVGRGCIVPLESSSSSSSSPPPSSPPDGQRPTSPAQETEQDPRSDRGPPSPFRGGDSWSKRLRSALGRVLGEKASALSQRAVAGLLVAAIALAVRKRGGSLSGRKLLRYLLAGREAPAAGLAATAAGSASAIANPGASPIATADPGTARTRKSPLGWILAGLCAALEHLRKTPDHAHAEAASLGLLRNAARNGTVQRALVGATDIVFRTGDREWKRTSLPPQSQGLKADLVDLLAKGGCGDIAALPDTLWEKAATPLLTALPFVYLAFAYRMLRGLQNGGDGGDFFSSKLLPGPKRAGNAKARTTFADVAGLDAILPEVGEIVSYLRNPSGFHALGAEPPRGILLHGSPGVGKTMIARAIAGEAGCDAFCVCSGSDFCEMYVGRGAGRVRTLFREARRAALRTRGGDAGWPWPLGSRQSGRGAGSGVSRPATAIVFIDELDAVARSRSHGGIGNANDERDQTLNQLLTEMDGFFRGGNPTAPGCGGDEGDVHVVVIAATNRPEVLDPAILRRFDRQIMVPLPDREGRAQILKVHASKTRCRFSTIHWDYLAEETPGFSGSDLKQVVNDAALLAVRQKSRHIEQGHLLRSIQRARAMRVRNDIAGETRGHLPPSVLPFVGRS